MSQLRIRNTLCALTQMTDWKLFAVGHKHTVRGGDAYVCRTLDFDRRSELEEYVAGIQREYLQDKGRLGQYEQVIPYDGSCASNRIYSLSVSDALVETAYQALGASILHPDDTTPVDDFSANGYMLTGTLSQEGGSAIPVKLITVKRPLVTLRNKYFYLGGRFMTPLNKVLSLCAYFDLLCLDQTLYFFNLNAEPFFSIERAYKKISATKAKAIGDAGIVNDTTAFYTYAAAGRNPRQFVSFSDGKLRSLDAAARRQEVSDTFHIPLAADGTFDVSAREDAERLIKYLCDRAMLDPQDLEPREVSGATAWK